MLIFLAAAPSSVMPGTTAPAAYEQSFVAKPPTGPRRALEASIADSLRKQRPGSMEDAPLAAAAERLLEELSVESKVGTSDASQADFERVRVLLWREGVADAAFLPYRGRFASKVRAQAALKGVIIELAALSFNRFGVRVREDARGVVDVAIVVAQRFVAFAPVPLRIDPVGASPLVTATSSAPTAIEQVPSAPARLLTTITTASPRKVSFVVRRPNGETAETSVGAVSTKPVPVDVELGKEPGRYDVEIVFGEASGPVIAAAFALAVAIPFDDVYRARLWEAEAGKVDAAVMEKRIGETIGERRARYGLPPQKRDGLLDRIAREHSQEMARFGFGRASASHGSLSKRLERAGVYFEDAAEVIGSGIASEAIVESLMTSPSHRLALLDGTLGDLGVGVTTVQASAAKPGVAPRAATAYVTLVLAKVVPKIDSADAEKRLVVRINEARAAAGLSPLSSAPALASVARKHAAAMALAGRPEYELPKHGSVFENAKKAFPSAKALGGFVGVLGSVEDPVEFEGLLDPQMTLVGVGVVQASSKEYGAGALWVVLTLAR